MEKFSEKRWSEMTNDEKHKAYQTAINSNQVDDTFEGFSKQMHISIFNVETSEPIEIS